MLNFVVAGLVLFVPGMWAVLTTEQLALHAMVNARHVPWADLLFRYGTHLADGLVPTILALLLLFKDLRSFLMMGLSCGFSAIITQFLKRQVFDGHDRPSMFRAQLGDMEWVAGLELNNHFSFPSGHATAALAMCFALAVIIGSPRMSVALALVGGLLAFSRVYLSQHFTEDILAGSVIGTLVAWAVYRWLYVSSFSQRPFLDRRIVGRKQ